MDGKKKMRDIAIIRVPRKTKNLLKARAAASGLSLEKCADKIIRSQFKDEPQPDYNIISSRKKRVRNDIV